MFHTVYCCCTTQQFRILKFSVKPLWIIDYFENWLDGIQLWFCEKTEERGDSSLARKLHPLGSKCEISWWEWEEGSPLLKMHIFVSKCICSEPQQIKNSLAAELNKFLFMTHTILQFLVKIDFYCGVFISSFEHRKGKSQMIL